ncbi:1847_t:CDS:2 [Diversispora eburnea]|uniref:1847_t:CDS:1 n=1 Tax=Diversispora eburnea TaxID=1213867 RepID=A0A9N9GEY6_9GLOM|nr:1847_t:CDS:2 [Diversispora eburnea]
MCKVKTIRNNVTLACKNCQKAKKKCSDDSPCERCLTRRLECEYDQPVKKRGPRPIHVNELNDKIGKNDYIADPYSNVIKNKNIFLTKPYDNSEIFLTIEDDDKIVFQEMTELPIFQDNAKERFQTFGLDDDIADPYSNVIKNKDIYRTMPYSRNDDITDLSRKYFLQPNAEDLKETSKLAF